MKKAYIYVDKRREPQTTFRWRRDRAGYDLSPDRRLIVRRGGALVEYDPAVVTPRLHLDFANVLPPAFGQDKSGGLIPIWQAGPPLPRKFRPEPPLLDFVNKYGFLGSDRSGADAESESVDYLIKTWRDINGVLSTGAQLGGIAEVLGEPVAGVGLTGPTLRMCLETDRNGRVSVHYRPESLSAWLWLRVADDLTSGIRWDGLPCLYCGSAMGRGPGGHRADAKFCTDGCRTYWHRLSAAEQKARKAEARARQRKETST